MPYRNLLPEEGKRLNARLSDLKVFMDTGVALLAGKASTWNDHAMAKSGTAGKTKLMAAADRRFGAFQSSLDDAARLLAKEDVFDVFHGTKHELDASLVPADQILAADKHSDDVRGLTMLANGYRQLQAARSIFIACKQKFGEALYAPATLTLQGTPKVKADPNVLAQARIRAKESQTLGDMLKAHAATDPALAALLGQLKEKLADQAATATRTLSATA